MRRQTSKPNLTDCRVKNLESVGALGPMEYCETHKQERSACYQMAEGNLCHICLDWHQPPNCADLKCECPDASEDHPAGECENRAYWTVERDGKEIHVCGACNLSRDINVRKLNPDRPF